MSRARYGWRPGSQVRIDAQLAGEEMERIRVKHNGRLEPDDLVQAAQSKQSPLHPAFEWNDHVAAKAFRIQQAGHLIRSITMDVSRSNLTDKPIRAFVSVSRDGDRSYTSMAHAMTDKDLRQQVLANAYRDLEAWRKRYAELTEFARVFAVVDEALAGS